MKKLSNPKVVPMVLIALLAISAFAILTPNVKPASAATGTYWAANLYVPAGGASTYLSNTVFQKARDMGITHITLWQYNFNEHRRTVTREQLVDAVQRMQNYGLKPTIVLEYNVNEAVALVTALKDVPGMIYEVGKEPHVSGPDSYATVDQYINYWNQIVTAARQIDPDAMYGGPVVGSPTTSSESRSGVYINAWLQQCDGDFLSVHSFPAGSTQADAINRATSNTNTDVQQLKAKLQQYGKPNMPIAITEIQYTSAVLTNGWDMDQNFMNQWTTAFMRAAQNQGVYLASFWVLMGYNNNFAMIRPPSQNYALKPQYYSVQSYIRAQPAPTPTSTPSPTPTSTPRPTTTPTASPTPTPTSTPTPPSSTGFAFEDGFESASFSLWGGTTRTSGDTVTISSNSPYRGTYSARFSTSGSTNSRENAFLPKTVSLSNAYARGCFRISPISTSSSRILRDNSDRFYLIQFTNSAGTLASCGVRREGGVDRWLLYADGTYRVSSHAVSPNQYYSVELHLDEASHIAELFVDGTRILQISIGGSLTSNISSTNFGIAYTTNVQNQLGVYGDCFKISSAYIGPQA